MKVWSIINITPDSFYSNSRAQSEKQIIEAARLAIDQGADILDVGAFSTRPNHDEVSQEEELSRLTTALNIICTHFSNVEFSIDTFRGQVVENLYDKFGPFVVNDIQGGVDDKKMLEVVGRLKLPYVMMSNDATMEQMLTFYDTMIPRAEALGVENIILDPGFGFGKDMEQNFEILRSMDALKKYDREILAGLSRKRMIYLTLNTNPENALNGTTALHWAALSQGATILRAHDTLAARQTITLYEKFATKQ